MKANLIPPRVQDYEPVTESAMPRKPIEGKLTSDTLAAIVRRNRAAARANDMRQYGENKFMYDMF